MLLDLRPLLGAVATVLFGGGSDGPSNPHPKNRQANDLAAMMFDEDEDLALVLGAL